MPPRRRSRRGLRSTSAPRAIRCPRSCRTAPASTREWRCRRLSSRPACRIPARSDRRPGRRLRTFAAVAGRVRAASSGGGVGGRGCGGGGRAIRRAAVAAPARASSGTGALAGRVGQVEVVLLDGRALPEGRRCEREGADREHGQRCCDCHVGTLAGPLHRLEDSSRLAGRSASELCLWARGGSAVRTRRFPDSCARPEVTWGNAGKRHIAHEPIAASSGEIAAV